MRDAVACPRLLGEPGRRQRGRPATTPGQSCRPLCAQQHLRAPKAKPPMSAAPRAARARIAPGARYCVCRPLLASHVPFAYALY